MADDKAWLTGHTIPPIFQPPPAALTRHFNGDSWDSYLTIINPLGGGIADLDYSTYLGGHGGSDYGYDIALADGNVWLTGKSSSPDFPLTGGAISTTVDDIFFAIIDPRTGKNGLLYSTFFGGSGFDQVHSMVVADSRAWLTGYTSSTDFPTTAGAYDTTYGGSNDAFLTVINPQGKGAGDVAYSTYLGDSNTDDRQQTSLWRTATPGCPARLIPPPFPPRRRL